MLPDIRIEDYHYPLPEERIAKYPLPRRDSSKLLIYRSGTITESVFSALPDLLSERTLMIFNNTRVVPARLHFQRPTGAHIEIFCLEPADPPEYSLAFAATRSCRWKCIIGHAKRWKDGPLTLYRPAGETAVTDLCATLIERQGETGLVEFSWTDGAPFSAVLDRCGTIPIPPYLNRSSESIDTERYQTLYARIRGSVAAPTAGLHFTEEVLSRIHARGIETENICLHVGAGTFLPVKSSRIADHPMHREPFSVSLPLLQRLLSRRPVTAVGTTSVRTLESLYYIGVRCIETGHPEEAGQWDPYTRIYPYRTEEALEALLEYLERNRLTELRTGTRLLIAPGFRFRLVDALVTNFHQPESTLLLLVSAFIGDGWREVYEYALGHSFRFLSYGDSSLLFRA